jgi:hypothetical protein
VKLLTPEPGTSSAIANYRRLGRPAVYFLPIHRLEVANAIRQKAFHQCRTVPAGGRSFIKKERDSAFAVLQKYISRKTFIEISQDMEIAIDRAGQLSEIRSASVAADSTSCTLPLRSSWNARSF